MSEHKRKVRTLWFKAKEYGWGWVPVTWQGWAITALYTLLFTLSTLVFLGWLGAATEAQANIRDIVFGILEFLIVAGILTYSLFRICTRYGEAPSWRWGRK